MSVRTPGTHFQGPLLGSNRSGRGLFENTSLGLTSRFMSPYKEFYEDFAHTVSTASMEDSGWTETAVGTAASRTHAYDQEVGALLINADTVADEGTSLQHNAAPASPATSVGPSNLLGAVTSTATLMDSKELIWAARVSPRVGTGTWSSKFLIGWFVTDTALMTPSTGALAIATGGGIGFHVTEAGQLNTVVQGTTSATSTDTGTDISAGTDWYDLGFRARWVDASAGTGQIDFFVNGVKVQTVDGATTALPMQSTQTYSNSIEVINGPATANQVDLYVEYIYNAMTRGGLTYPYNSGLNY